jgi:hypothetical protein
MASERATENLKRWLIVGSIPTLAFVVGAIALPHPMPVAAEKEGVDREALGAAVSRIRPTPRATVDAELGDSIRVLGADLPEASLSRGARLAARFYFEATGELDRDWQIFLHIDAKSGGYRIHGDHFPVRGKYPTTLWQAGDFIADDWSTIIPRDAPAGVYDVWLGFYVGDDRLDLTGGTATAHDGNSRVRVGSIVIE